MTENHTIRIELPPALRALADPTRLKIMLMLEGKARTVGEIVDFFDFSQPTITRHLQTLASAGLVHREKDGQRVIYALNSERVRSLCVDLAGCFPCCCVAVTKPSDADRATESKSDSDTECCSDTESETPKEKGDQT